MNNFGIFQNYRGHCLDRPAKLTVLLKLALAGLLITLLCFFRLLAGPRESILLMRYAGYWLTLALVLGLVLWVWKYWRGSGIGLGLDRRAWRLPCLIAVLGGVLWQIHEPHQFKVLYDEHAYVAISKEMHLSREACYASRLHYFHGDPHVLAYSVDKRAVLFPFLVSVLHDLTGFRKENVFILNALLGFLSILLTYYTLVKIASHRVAMAGQLLWIGLPLLAQVATGGGYDLLNISLIQGWLLIALRYAGGGDSDETLDLFVWISVALAQVRNESIFFAFGTLLVVAMVWCRRGGHQSDLGKCLLDCLFGHALGHQYHF